MILRVALGFAALSLAVAAAPVGPTATEFQALRTAQGETCPTLRQLKCTTLGDPTEYTCKYQEHFKGKGWTSTTALVGRDGTSWVWLDGGPRCSSLPQH